MIAARYEQQQRYGHCRGCHCSGFRRWVLLHLGLVTLWFCDDCADDIANMLRVALENPELGEFSSREQIRRARMAERDE